MRRARASRAVVCLAVAIAGCTSSADNTTTTSTAPTTTPTTVDATNTSTTTSTTETPTTSTATDPWGIDYPLEPDTVDDIPAVLTDQIGAPEPDPELTVEGPDDLDRWVDEWLGWFSWINANPAEGMDALEHAVIPGSALYENTLAALKTDRDEGRRLLGFAFKPVEVSGTFDEFFERQELLRLVVVASDDIPSYVVDNSGIVLTVNQPLGGETTIRLLLRYRQEEGEWVLENLEVLG